MLKLVLDPGDRVNVITAGEEHLLEAESDTAIMLDSLQRFDMLFRNGYKPENNVHTEYVKRFFAPFDGYYVMAEPDAEKLANTGRDMSDVLIYDYADADAAVLRRYNNRNSFL